MGTTPVDERAFTEPGDEFDEKTARAYDEIIADHAETTGARYVNLRYGFNMRTMLARDRIHPNERGNYYMYEMMGPVIMEALGAPLDNDAAAKAALTIVDDGGLTWGERAHVF